MPAAVLFPLLQCECVSGERAWHQFQLVGILKLKSLLFQKRRGQLSATAGCSVVCWYTVFSSYSLDSSKFFIMCLVTLAMHLKHMDFLSVHCWTTGPECQNCAIRYLLLSDGQRMLKKRRNYISLL